MDERPGPSSAKSWAEFYEEPLDLKRMLAWATTHAPVIDALLDTTTVLEVGTGTAVLSGIISTLGKHVTSLDLDIRVQNVARTNVKTLNANVAFTTGDAFSIPFADGSFDAAFSQGFFEHFDDESLRKLIDEQLRVAHRVVFSVPNRWYPHVGRFGPGLIGNERLMSKQQWATVLKQYDPVVIDYRDPKVFSLAGVMLGPRIHTLVVIN